MQQQKTRFVCSIVTGIIHNTDSRAQFEIAVEETEKKTVYAADDRSAAAEELKKLVDMFEAAMKEESAEVTAEIKSRVGQRIRELDGAIKGLEESALED